MVVVRPGERVRAHYTTRDAAGSVLESTRGGEPAAFTAGGDDVIPALARAVIGMAPGESKRITGGPEEGYGARRDGLELQVPRRDVPVDVRVSDPVRLLVGEEELVVWVKNLADDVATLDGNHPLAGHTLVFDLELVDLTVG